MAKAKTDKVIRRVVLGKTYNVFSMKMENGMPQMAVLEQDVEYSTRPTETEMCEKHKVDKVVIIATGTKIGHYGVYIEKFMELATLEKTELKKVDDDKEEEKTGEAENKEGEAVE
jgi:hypothetical protein